MDEYLEALYTRKTDLINAMSKAMSRARITDAKDLCVDSIRHKGNEVVIIFKDKTWIGFEATGNDDAEIEPMGTATFSLLIPHIAPQLYAELQAVEKEIKHEREKADRKRNEERDRFCYEELKKRFGP